MRVLLILVYLALFLYSKDKYEIYTEKLLHYHFNLEYNIKPPFEAKKMKRREIKKIIEYVNINLLSIFNHQALVRVDYYKGDTLVFTREIWVKKGEKIKNCLIKDIYLDRILLKCGKKLEIKTLAVPLKIKEKR